MSAPESPIRRFRLYETDGRFERIVIKEDIFSSRHPDVEKLSNDHQSTAGPVDTELLKVATLQLDLGSVKEAGLSIKLKKAVRCVEVQYRVEIIRESLRYLVRLMAPRKGGKFPQLVSYSQPNGYGLLSAELRLADLARHDVKDEDVEMKDV